MTTGQLGPALGFHPESACTAAAPAPALLLPQPPQAATAAGSASAAAQLKQLSSKRAAVAECRICLSEGSAEQELIQPCTCAGTMGYTHAACLVAWVQEKGSLTCELCQQHYQKQYVQVLGLKAAAGKTGNKKGTGPAAADGDGNPCRSWLGIRFWLL